ncbi:DNA mismatch repair endonuclease MutL [Oceanobacillus halotolerans]|uniref:DNA mismatch repair endonuclease MutL n=1 Tax=Oceanobacillus halotolerans TaxID=2663380 RepID=UPI0013DD772F|nr:DNA mismatch repair endonuclease MutL [Oceanobacillus halotolerans]
MTIYQLPDSLANKIAAGEVVERPASVVKELVENSIDAKSTWIKVDLMEAGLQQIKITDNGIGMDDEDVQKAFLRHATSKIKNETDLFHVKTLGFRGEALASIAAVSKLTIKTSKGNEAGTLLTLEGGKIVKREKSDARQGTEVNVESLFYNTPARLKYMKTIHTELGHITDLLNRLALSHPGIRFEATHNGKQLFKTTGSNDLLQVIANVYGMGVARQMLPIQKETLDFSISGYIAKPEITRASRNYISTIINGRYIKSLSLTKAIMQGYHTLLPIGRNPIVVLSIDMDPILVDVNVHPTKLEVRFSKEKELFEAMKDGIQSKFREITLIPEMEKSNQQSNYRSEQHSFNLDQYTTTDAEQIQENDQSWDRRAFTEADQTTIMSPSSTTSESSQMNEELQDLAIYDNKIPTSVAPAKEVQQTTEKRERVPTMYPIGQLHGTYILAQNDDGLYMIDQHAAQERIKYEFFKEKLGRPINESQELLIPLTFEFSKQEAIIIDHYKEDLEHVGIFLEPFGNQSYIIRSYPTWFPKGFEEEVLREIVEQVMKEEKINIESIREEAAILMSCKRSIKANHYLNHDDMFRLLEDLRSTTDPFTCPHGRPIIVHFSSYELEKMFKRVM